MTDPTTTPTDTTTTADSSETTSDAAELAREARNWRKKYQSLKAETETLTTRLDNAQRQIVEYHLAGKIADPDDYWRTTTLEDLRDDTGDINPEAVSNTLAELLSVKPHYAPPRPGSFAVPTSEVTGNTPIRDSPSDTSWSAVLGQQKTGRIEH